MKTWIKYPQNFIQVFDLKKNCLGSNVSRFEPGSWFEWCLFGSASLHVLSSDRVFATYRILCVEIPTCIYYSRLLDFLDTRTLFWTWISQGAVIMNFMWTVLSSNSTNTKRELLLTLFVFYLMFNSVCSTRSGHLMASAGRDRSIRLWVPSVNGKFVCIFWNF